MPIMENVYSLLNVLELWPKIALLAGLFMIVGPAVLRMEYLIDLSTFTAFFAVGLVLIIIANNNRRRPDDHYVRRD
jgi:hypothetical protein